MIPSSFIVRTYIMNHCVKNEEMFSRSIFSKLTLFLPHFFFFSSRIVIVIVRADNLSLAEKEREREEASAADK